MKGLRFDDRPDYDHLKKLFRELFFRKGFSYDNLFDWELLQSMGSQANTSGGGAPTGPINPGAARMGGEFLQQTGDLTLDDRGNGFLMAPGRPDMGIDEEEEGEEGGMGMGMEEPEGESRDMVNSRGGPNGGKKCSFLMLWLQTYCLRTVRVTIEDHKSCSFTIV